MTQTPPPSSPQTDPAAAYAGQPGPTGQPGPRTLYRDPNGMIGGVAGGIANLAGIDPTIVRLGFVLSTVIAGVGPLIYLAAWVIVPEQPAYPQPLYGPAPSTQA